MLFFFTYEKKMGSLLLKKPRLIIFLLIISSSLISNSFAGRGLINFADEFTEEGNEIIYEEESTNSLPHHREDDANVHERLLRMLSHDYGRYNPSPSLSKPRYKLIPN